MTSDPPAPAVLQLECPFRVGDRVICVRAITKRHDIKAGYRFGDILTVGRIDLDGDFYSLETAADGRSMLCFRDEFLLAAGRRRFSNPNFPNHRYLPGAWRYPLARLVGCQRKGSVAVSFIGADLRQPPGAPPEEGG